MPFTWTEHVGEVAMRLEAEDEAGVFVAALEALGDLLAGHDEGPDSGEAEVRRVCADGADRATLLAAWLEELNYLAESEGLLPVGAEGIELADRQVCARVRVRRGHPPHLVKAVTYHRLSFERRDGGWVATVVLDV